jgi:hypothetical protein
MDEYLLYVDFCSFTMRGLSAARGLCKKLLIRIWSKALIRSSHTERCAESTRRSMLSHRISISNSTPATSKAPSLATSDSEWPLK